MSEPYLGEIRMFSGNFAPYNWARCDGQLLNISQNAALFSLLGTAYGGDGQTSFGLPDLRGRLPMHHGRASWGTTRGLGERVGTESVTLLASQMPAHTHGLMGSSDGADSAEPAGRLFADTGGADAYTATAEQPVPLGSAFLGNAGAGQPHENRMPSLGLNFIIALQGIFPQRAD
jgi:microcystin-dependent protein